MQHIDFLEIAGDESTVLIIGFRQNQSEQKHNDYLEEFNQNLSKLSAEEILQRAGQQISPAKALATPAGHLSVVPLPTDRPAHHAESLKRPESLANESVDLCDQEDAASESEAARVPQSEQRLQRRESGLDASRHERDHAAHGSAHGSSLLELQHAGKMTPNQLNLLRQKLREQVERHKLRHYYSGDYTLVSSSNFHLQIEFDNFQKAREIKSIIERIKRVHRKERALLEMLCMHMHHPKR